MAIRNKQGQFTKNNTGKNSLSWKGGLVKYICKVCKKIFTRYPSQKGNFCSKKCYWIDKKGKPQEHLRLLSIGRKPWNKGGEWKGIQGKNHWNWKGGYWINDAGYKIIQNEKETKGKKEREHRKIMEEFLGRKLKRKEHIHHINGNKLDNRIKNLMILNPSEHQLLHIAQRRNKNA